MSDFQNIVDDFEFLEDWEERYKYVIDLGKNLPELTDEERNDATKVRGCASQVWLVFDQKTSERITFRGDSDAHIVKGLVAIMVALFSGQSAKDITYLDTNTALAHLDLKDHITPQRSNGLSAMIARIKNEAALIQP